MMTSLKGNKRSIAQWNFETEQEAKDFAKEMENA